MTYDGEPVDGPTSVRLGTGPGVLQADAGAAPTTYAVRYAGTPRWLAAGACPDPRQDWWFVGAGASQLHASELVLANPREGTAIADVSVLGPDGPVKAPGLQGIKVASRHTVHLDLAKVAPAVGDLAVHVQSERGLIAASMPERWQPGPLVKPVREWVAAQPRASRRQTLVGLDQRVPHGRLLVANPSSKEAVVELSLVGDSGTYTPTRHKSVTVPPASVKAVGLDRMLRSHPGAVRVRAPHPVVASLRRWHGADESYAVASAPVGSHAVAGVPAHSSARLELVSRARAKKSARARVRVTSYGRDGKVLDRRTVTVSPGGMAELDLPKGAAAVDLRTIDGAGKHVRSVAAALLVSRGDGRIAAVPVSSTTSATRVPAVEPDW